MTTSLFLPPANPLRCEHGQAHSHDPHACCDTHQDCPYWFALNRFLGGADGIQHAQRHAEVIVRVADLCRATDVAVCRTHRPAADGVTFAVRTKEDASSVATFVLSQRLARLLGVPVWVVDHDDPNGFASDAVPLAQPQYTRVA